MKLIDPDHISAEILTVIRDAKEKLIIVSPYNVISKWYKLINYLKAARDRPTEIEFYVRAKEANNGVAAIKKLQIEPIEIPNLHVKIYMNESVGIVTSFNLLLTSEINSLDIAYKTDTTIEYKELFAFYEKHIRTHKPKTIAQVDPLVDKWPAMVKAELKKRLETNVRVYEEEDALKLNVWSNVYHLSIDRANGHPQIFATGVLSGKQYQRLLKTEKELSKQSSFAITLKNATGGHYDLICGRLERPVKSASILKVYSSESIFIIDEMSKFVQLVAKIKNENS